jgi:hypothetical protein
MEFFAWRPLTFLALSPILFAVVGCGNQAEGERCDYRNGNADCSEGLICTHIQPTERDYICCPFAPPVTVAACNGGGGPIPDAGSTSDGSSTDAGIESGTDSSAPDAVGNDAPSEATGDRSTVDTRSDVAVDMSADMSTPDIQPEASNGDATDAQVDSPSGDGAAPDASDDTPTIDAPSIDTAPDALMDATGEVSSDAFPVDVTTPIDAEDAADAPSADGPG